MGVKGDNVEINSGLVLSSFILNYMVIRVKEKELEEEKEERNERGKEKNAEESKGFGG